MTQADASAPADRHPRGLRVLFFTEMWERFSFYLMIGILYQYLVDSEKGGMGWDELKATSIVGSYVGLVYFTPFLGGLIADRLLGCRATIILGGLFMAAGHILLAFPTEMMLYLALLALIIGNGLFKPNISTMVGNLYPPGSPLRDAGFNIFYMGINIGAFFCNFVAAVVRNRWGWHWAFATAGFGMLLGLVIFLTNQKHIRHADRDPRHAGGPKESLMPLWVGCLGPAAVLAALGWWLAKRGGDGGFLGLGPATTAFLFACLPVVAFFVWVWRSLEQPTERARVGALLAIYGVVIVFWAVFQQNSTALTDWALKETDRVPSAATRWVVGLAPDFAETAPPSYFANADPATPRPHRDSFEILPDERYEELKQAKALSVDEGRPVPVTQAMFDQIYARADATTPILPPGRQLKLMNAELFQSINPAFVILLTPLLVGLWRWLRARGKEPSTPTKIGMGLMITALSALVMVAASRVLEDTGTKVSPWWLWGTYGVITVGELCLSPMGLSLVTKMSPGHIKSFMMGGWFLSTAIGNKLSGVFGEVYQKWEHDHFFLVNTAVPGVAAAMMFVLLPWLRRQMGEETPAAEAPGDGLGKLGSSREP